MLWKWPIRVKLLVGLGLLVLLVGILSASGLYTMYAYRTLAKNLSSRVGELPVAAELDRQVGGLRNTLSELNGLSQRPALPVPVFPRIQGEELLPRAKAIRGQFRRQLDQVDQTLSAYRSHLDRKLLAESRMADNRAEKATVSEIEGVLSRIRQLSENDPWIFGNGNTERLSAELTTLETLVAQLPSHLRARLIGLRDEVRREYRTLIAGTWITIAVATVFLILFVRLAWHWILHPLRTIMRGSQRVASGEFGYRIHLDGDDEMARLAEAMNGMTSRFEAIRDDLDAKVRQRTQQVVRGEQLASVGFLAAGVAHEINNPLASIAMAAESLQSRIGELLPDPLEDADDEPCDGHRTVMIDYLQMIQDEAFRCKEITEKLLDFSRTGPTQRQRADLGGLVGDMVDMVRHMGRYRSRQIDFTRPRPVMADVNPTEIKQVVLNLLTNALDSLDDDGTVRIDIRQTNDSIELTVIDDGCGMEPDVLRHVFEPFFTRRPSGRGTGLGLSITHQIVVDHGGRIVAESLGAGRGSTFRVHLPGSSTSKENNHRYQAA